ncbi:putative cysteine-rich repeat secretory protein 7 [Amaranthus tricolor]|uniref:putative cysteine-rich repeat secretory protein 7 n=1 Tax=Amaranthus tricolor TaxID=29722 RepID=UPI00259093DD|nr:putative cysteine-rich repeat secretory protein 7 [Amaranthus tricolor]
METFPNYGLIIFIFIFLNNLLLFSQFQLFNEFCVDESGKFTPNSFYQNNLNLLLSSLKNKSSSSLFDTHIVGQGTTNQIYGLYMCRGDLDLQQCHDCVGSSSLTIIQTCPVQKEAISWYLQCMIRYSNLDIFSTVEISPLSYAWRPQNVSNRVLFRAEISKLMVGLVGQTAYNTSKGGYGIDKANVTSVEDVYVLMQCTFNILGSACESCLRVLIRNIESCCGITSLKLAMFSPSCWVRYEVVAHVEPFLSSTPSFENNFTTMSTPLSQGRSTASAVTSSCIYLISGLLIVVTMSFITTW